MKTSLLAALALVISTLPAVAGERTVRLAVENMYCSACPYVVRESLTRIPGVVEVEVSYADKTATVTFDDEKADIAALMHATGRAGYPSSPAR